MVEFRENLRIPSCATSAASYFLPLCLILLLVVRHSSKARLNTLLCHRVPAHRRFGHLLLAPVVVSKPLLKVFRVVLSVVVTGHIQCVSHFLYFCQFFLNLLQYNPNQARDAAMYSNSRFSAAPSEHSASSISASAEKAAILATTATVPNYLWDKDPDLDDALHNPDPVRDAKLDRSFTFFSARGWANAGALFILILAIITLFAGYPIIDNFAHPQATITGFNLGGINGTGQIPDLPGMPSLIDTDTPSSAYSRTGSDGKTYNLVFSDEFNKEGRTFYPGDDPYWEAVDLHYW